MLLLFVMLTLGLALVRYANAQQGQAGYERTRESSFALTEATLKNQILQLGREWPGSGSGGTPYPASCVTGATDGRCPSTAALAAAYTGPDYGTSSCATGVPAVPWSTTVRDNGAITRVGGVITAASPDVAYYSRALVDPRPTWDANGDGRMWVRSTGVARCRVQTVVALVAQTLVPVRLPRNAVTANWFETTNRGRKVIIDTQGNAVTPPAKAAPQPATVSVRCAGRPAGTCAAYSTPEQVSPNTVEQNVSGTSPAVSPAQLDSFRRQAVAAGRYYAGCPGSALAGMPGELVFVEDAGTNCPLTGGFSNASPGFLVVATGSVTLGGNSVLYGILYMANLGNLPGTVVSINGTAAVQGAVIIDGPGGLSAGASKANLVFDPRGFGLAKGQSGAGVVPNSFRVLPGGQ